MTRMKLGLTTMLALIVSSVSLVAVAQSAGTAQTVRVTESSYAIRSRRSRRPGSVKFQIRNASDDGHDFWLRGGGKTWKTRVLGEAGSRQPDGDAEEGRPLHVLVRDRRPPRGRDGGSFVAR